LTVVTNSNSLSAIKKGPNTADIDTRTMANAPGGKTGNNSRYLEPDTVTKGTARKFLKGIGGSKSQYQQQQQRQSPSHLAIPQQQSSHHARQQGASPGHMTRSQQQLQQYQQQQYQGQGSRSKREASPTSPNRAASSSNLLNNLQDRTAMVMMQRYLTNPDDPDSEVDIATQIMISQAAVDSKGFEILEPEAVDGIKRVSHR
jgi:transcription initiation factor TFIID subunit TAF12